MDKQELIELLKKALEEDWVIEEDNIYNPLSDVLDELSD